MAQRIHHFSIPAPTGTTPTNPYSANLTFPSGLVVAFELRMPAGHRGKTGFQLAYGGTQVIPLSGSIFYHGNKETHRWEWDDPYPGGTGWFTQTYNTGRYAHNFRVQVELDDLVPLADLLPPVLLLRQAF